MLGVEVAVEMLDLVAEAARGQLFVLNFKLRAVTVLRAHAHDHRARDDAVLARHAQAALEARLLALGLDDLGVVCDKKNNSNQLLLLSKAAERFQQLGMNYSALKIVSDLEAQNFTNQTLTNTKFLAGVKLADQALTQMREKQLRYLTEEDTYPPAKILVDNIEKSRPSNMLVKEAPKVVTPTVRPKTRTTSSRQGGVNRNTGSTRSNTTNTRNSQTQRVITTPTPPPKSTNPFGSL